jgi:hypothetical protein
MLICPVDRHRINSTDIHAAVKQRQGPVGPHPQPLAAVEEALARGRGHADEALVRGGLELLEVDGGEEFRVDAGDVVTLDEIVGVDRGSFKIPLQSETIRSLAASASSAEPSDGKSTK